MVRAERGIKKGVVDPLRSALGLQGICRRGDQARPPKSVHRKRCRARAELLFEHPPSQSHRLSSLVAGNGWSPERRGECVSHRPMEQNKDYETKDTFKHVWLGGLHGATAGRGAHEHSGRIWIENTAELGGHRGYDLCGRASERRELLREKVPQLLNDPFESIDCPSEDTEESGSFGALTLVPSSMASDMGQETLNLLNGG
ncbi:hypothetical protein JEQ12_020657 [Ovis aries]|uniref:Uncharacterized protein n=1 Tax=Ovis aries TaxID=9940 RepID=A0A836CNM1_SHEEP|nr:hypothetical protein JEQ12_020657 [Ovis aries]